MNKARKLVSKQKRRYNEDGFDLDLSYIGNSRLIAMGFPSESIESAYRNPYKEVKRFLDTKHNGHYMVYNLCSEKDRQYKPEKFHDMVACFPFEDHNPPPFGMIEKFCENVHEFLSKDKDNVAAIHCKAGKGRTGTMIICHLLYTKFYIFPQQAQDFYAAMRTFNQKGLTIPSQIRYVNYFGQTVGKKVKPCIDYVPPTIFLKKIFLTPIPNVSNPKAIKFKLECNRKPIFTFKGEVEVVKKKKKSDKKGEDVKERVVFKLEKVPICGDIKLTFTNNNNKFFHFWFNTAFIRNLHMKMKKSEIDGANKDKKHKTFPQDFQIDLYFDGQDPAPIPLKEEGVTFEKDDMKLIKPVNYHQEADGRFILTSPDFEFCYENDEELECVSVSIKALRSIVSLVKDVSSEGLIDEDISKKIFEKKEYKEFLSILKEFQLITFNYLSQETLAVFWLNTYHVMLLHSLLEYNPKNLEERNFMYKTATYYINGQFYSLLEIHHVVIRCGNSAPHYNFPTTKMYTNKDDRLNQVLDHDARYLLAASFLQPFSPPLRLFSAKDFSRQLQECATYFLDKHVKIDLDHKTVSLSGFVHWYSQDFGKDNAAIINFLKNNMSTKESEKLSTDFSVKLVEDKSLEWKKFHIEEFPSDYVLTKHIIETNKKPTIETPPPPVTENKVIEQNSDDDSTSSTSDD